MKWLVSVVVLALLAGGGYVGYDQLVRVKGSPQKTAEAYFTAWQRGDFAAMTALVAAPPATFGEQHRTFSAGLKVKSLALAPKPVVKDGEKAAHADFTAVRTLPPGKWQVVSTLKMAVVDRRWKVKWTPDVLMPGIRDLKAVKLEKTDVSVPTVVAADGQKIDGTTVTPYLSALAGDYGTEGEPGWVLKDGSKVIQEFGSTTNELKSTIDRKIQKAADDAVSAAGKPAALVAVKPSTGEVLAVADGLGGGNLAFQGKYPPGSTFKVVTAAALLQSGLTPSSKVACPQRATAGTRTIPNHDDLDLGSTTLNKAFAHSCNTTFSLLTYQRLKGDALRQMAIRFGFERPFAYNAQRASFPTAAGTDELVEDAIGQGKVETTPLNMAMVAAAVADGTWRSPRMLAARLYEAQGQKIPEPQALPAGIVDALRPMMRAVVTEGTAAGLGMPAGTYGKTGTAEYNAAGDSHAWFIGYRGDLAFAALVPKGGSGPKVAAPIAARFLKGL